MIKYKINELKNNSFLENKDAFNDDLSSSNFKYVYSFISKFYNISLKKGGFIYITGVRKAQDYIKYIRPKA